MNEPALDDRPFGDPGNKISFPLDAPQGPTEEITTHKEVHNLYGLIMAQASYQGAKISRPTERSFILTRSGYLRHSTLVSYLDRGQSISVGTLGNVHTNAL